VQKTLTSVDIAAIILELEERLRGARVQNIYQLAGKTLILKLHQPNQPALNLLVEPGKRLHLTSYLFEKPQRPPSFCMALRKHLRARFIEEINQHEFERIIVIKAGKKEDKSRLILELFGEGNVILVDSQGVIQQALRFKRMRDRDILRGEPFQQAPSSGKNPLNLKPPDLLDLKEFTGVTAAKALTKLLSIGGLYAEEILLRSHIEKNLKCEHLKEAHLERMYTCIKELLAPLETGKISPRVVKDEKGRLVDAIPIPLRKYDGFGFSEYESINRALDEYYAQALIKRKVTKVAEAAEQEIARQQRILEEQRESLKEAKKRTERMRQIGDKIYSHFAKLQTLLQRITAEKKLGKPWAKIVSKIDDEKKNGEVPAIYFDSLDTRRLVLNVSVEGLNFPLKLRDTAQGNAARYYEQAKKAARKAEGAEKAIAATVKRIEEQKRRGKVAVEHAEKPIKKRRRKAWYEKFRWFITSEGLLAVGGKDAVTNEILIKKHMDPRDLVFHADIQGAPFVLLKTGGKAPAQQSIYEAAQLAASHSKAWKAKFSAIDVYWINPKQVSKTPPSGQYLQKGAFMIRGEKNYVRKTPLRLTIGVDVKAKPPRTIGGPRDAVRSKADIYVDIVPGDLSSSKLAKKIRHKLERKAPPDLREKISKIPIEEIQTFLPHGKGETASR
jgi:predicted ribosome quality control (RQC) complex YloA/Tae2 family protein